MYIVMAITQFTLIQIQHISCIYAPQCIHIYRIGLNIAD